MKTSIERYNRRTEYFDLHMQLSNPNSEAKITVKYSGKRGRSAHTPLTFNGSPEEIFKKLYEEAPGTVATICSEGEREKNIENLKKAIQGLESKFKRKQYYEKGSIITHPNFNEFLV